MRRILAVSFFLSFIVPTSEAKIDGDISDFYDRKSWFVSLVTGSVLPLYTLAVFNAANASSRKLRFNVCGEVVVERRDSAAGRIG
jgi:hypothetical protein